MVKGIFFDAAGTLVHLVKSVGQNYALVGKSIGLELDATSLDKAFARVWKEMPVRAPIDQRGEGARAPAWLSPGGPAY